MGVIPDRILKAFADSGKSGTYKIKELFGEARKNGEKSIYDYTKWRWMATCPYRISNKCCDVMKKSPAHSYAKRTGRKMISGVTASESRLRTMQWLRHGCNGFDMKTPVSNPMSFWMEQDVLQYIWQNKIPIASVYGDVVVDYAGQGDVDGQMSFRDLGGDWELFDSERPLLKTTGVSRTGCMFCGYGCHLEKPGEGRFERMKVTHPKQYDYIMRPKEQGGLGYKEVIDWINEHGNLNIRY
jgi:3'-phosphoadenosine 5'-phosphosulfate sulfotransferase (PAPS reductase)/FAD synthetase